MKKTLMLLISLMVCYFTSFSTFAYEFNFLKDAPASYFTDQDWQMYKNTAKNALNNQRDGSKVSWKNPKSGNGGHFQLIKTSVKNGLTCRQLKVFTYARKRTDVANYEVCKYSSGWKIPGDQD
jgi:hypothetical protein